MDHIFHNFDGLLETFMTNKGVFQCFVANHHQHPSQERHLDHLDLNDFLFLITFLAVLEAKLDFIEP